MLAYHEIVSQLEKLHNVGRIELEVISVFEGYPIYGFKCGSPLASSKLLLASGLHGDEPAPLIGLLQWLADSPLEWGDFLQITVLPCLNPGGVERGQRQSISHGDLNRGFHVEDLIIVKDIRKYLGADRFPLAVDLHEDLEMDKFYLWELTDSKRVWGEKIAQAVAPLVPLSHLEKPDGITTFAGVIPVSYYDVQRRIHEGLGGRPFAHFVMEHFTPCAITTELPGKLGVERRVHIQTVMLQSLVEQACIF